MYLHIYSALGEDDLAKKITVALTTARLLPRLGSKKSEGWKSGGPDFSWEYWVFLPRCLPSPMPPYSRLTEAWPQSCVKLHSGCVPVYACTIGRGTIAYICGNLIFRPLRGLLDVAKVVCHPPFFFIIWVGRRTMSMIGHSAQPPHPANVCDSNQQQGDPLSPRLSFRQIPQE